MYSLLLSLSIYWHGYNRLTKQSLTYGLRFMFQKPKTTTRTLA